MKKSLVGLCACTMGLAHTFMAAEALEQAARQKGYNVKVETQGADGIQNELTRYEIETADIVIISSSIKPDNMEKFCGIEVYDVDLKDIIKDASVIIEEIESDLGI